MGLRFPAWAVHTRYTLIYFTNQVRAPAGAAAPRGAHAVATEHIYHAFELIATALSKKISVFRSSALKVVPISPNAS